METNHWINDAKTIIGCEPPQLFKVLAKLVDEDNERGLFARKSYTKILECMEDVKYFLGEIRRNAQDFTLHDLTHCINVIDFMGQMLVDVEKLNPAEISFFIYSALLHDIGMVKLPEENISLNALREDHGDRSARFIRERRISTNNGKQLDFGEWDDVYMTYLPPICASHMQEFSFVEKLSQSIFIDNMEVDISLCAILLRLADAMDLKRNRAPYQLYQFIINRSISEDHWKKHMSISSCRIDERGIYRVDGICNDELAHRCLYNHLEMIESEIEKVFKWKTGTHPRLRLSSHIIERNIKTDNYAMWHHTFSMDILKITNLFMGEQLYGDKKLGLREIIQNSIDACMVRDEMNKKLGAKQDYSYKPEIYIILDEENNQVIIRDNGTGMNEHIIQNYFLNIGASYYSSRDFEKENLKYNPSGYFGIGFLACFMLSDDVYVRTAHWKENIEYEFHFIKSDRFVTKIEKPKTFSGTEIRLNLDQFEKVLKVYPIAEITESDLIIKSNINSFLLENFWNIQVDQVNDNVMLYSLRKESFREFAKKVIRIKSIYKIDLSEYFKDIDGFIYLSQSKLFDKMKCLTTINESYPLEAIKKGEIKISNNLKIMFPFIKHFYAFKEGEFIEIENNYNIIISSLILFPTKESKIKPEGIMSKHKELTDYEIKEYFSLYSWNCICINDNIEYSGSKLISFIKYRNINYLGRDLSLKKLKDCTGYYPPFFIEAMGVNTNRLNYVEYHNNDTWGFEDGIYWLKQARINLPNNINQVSHFSYFNVETINMKISNSLIIPDSSRKFIVYSAASKLVHAVSICIYLWVYDQIKNNEEALVTTKYLKQLILKEWDDSVEGLLRPEKKPA